MEGRRAAEQTDRLRQRPLDKDRDTDRQTETESESGRDTDIDKDRQIEWSECMYFRELMRSM